MPAQFKVFWETATKNLKPNRERMQFINDGEEIIPGVHAMFAPGHTVGHTIFMIDSGGKQLCFVGDLAHHPILLLERPLTEFKYDTDPKQSARSRVKMLSMLAYRSFEEVRQALMARGLNFQTPMPKLVFRPIKETIDVEPEKQ